MNATNSCGGEGPFHPERSLPQRWTRQHDEIRAALRGGRVDRALALLCEHVREYGCDPNTLLAGCAHEEGDTCGARREILRSGRSRSLARATEDRRSEPQ